MNISERTKEIVNWHLAGHSRAQIIEALSAMGVLRPGAAIDAALREVAAVAGTGDQDVAWYKAALRMLYAANVEEKNLKDAHHVLKDMMAVDDVIGGAKRRSNMAAAGVALTLETGTLTTRKKASTTKGTKSTKRTKATTGKGKDLTTKNAKEVTKVSGGKASSGSGVKALVKRPAKVKNGKGVG